MNNKLETLTNLFQGKEIRSIWDNEKEDYYFSVVDVIAALAEPKDASDYWTTLKRRMLKLMFLNINLMLFSIIWQFLKKKMN